MRSVFTAFVAAFVGVAALGASLAAQDTFYVSALRDLRLAEGAALPEPTAQYPRQWQLAEHLHPYAVLDEGDGFVVSESSNSWAPAWDPSAGVIAARVPAGAGAAGTLYLPNEDWSGLTPVRFTFEPAQAVREARERYFAIRAQHYERLLARNIPGAAYFRWQADQARGILKAEYNQEPPARQRPFDAPELDDTYNLFTGGRAVGENLQLHRDITAVQGQALDDQVPPEDLVEVASITGVTVREMDFKALLGEAEPALDPLAAAIPADQHAVFFPSFEALAAVADETSEDGLPLFRGLRARSEDAGLVARYEMQLGLSTRGLARLMGPLVVRSVAVTGSDPYFPTGTDVALLFESPNPAGLRELLWAQVQLARGAEAGVERVQGEAGGVAYTGLIRPDRAVSSYIAVVGQAVVASNSLHQLERLGAVHEGASASLASLDEYRFFRMRYTRGDTDESALAILPDGAIRRWCGPQWRIGASRRLRAAAVLSDITAANMPALVAGLDAARPVTGEVPMRTIGETTLTPGGARSSVYNTLAFLTPIAELGITEATKDEAAAYERWRDTYQRNWRWAFDPIAIRLGVAQDRLAADVTVMPLIFATRYATWMTFSQGATITPGSADPHDTLAHFVAAVNPESPSLKQATGFAMMIAPGLEVDPLGWLGQTAALYADPGPFWAEMLAAGEPDWFNDNLFRAPVGLRAEVKSPLKLTAFLASARAFIEQSSPGMLAWENRTHNGQAYVRVGLSDEARADAGDDPAGDAALYYAPMPRAITLSLNEDVVKRAIEREQGRRATGDDQAAAPPPPSQERPWLGESLALQFTAEGLGLIEGPGGETLRLQRQEQCWSNLPILNEWRRLFPAEDPVKVHERIWGVRLACPAEGSYAWDEKFRTIGSTSLGHPGEPKPGPGGLGPLQSITSGNLGVTFQENGLRARAEIQRTP